MGGFVRTKPGIEHPDLQYHFVPACVVGQAEVLNQHGCQVHCSTMRPHSTGHVRLQDADPLAAPLIDPKFLADPRDVEDIRDGVRLTVELASQPALANLTTERYSPGPQVRGCENPHGPSGRLGLTPCLCGCVRSGGPGQR